MSNSELTTIEELLDLVVTLRICQRLHPGSNSRLCKCAQLCRKRYVSKMARVVSKKLSKSDNVIRDVRDLQQ